MPTIGTMYLQIRWSYLPWRQRDICPLAPRGSWQNECAPLDVLLTLSQFLLGGGGASVQ